MTVPSDNHRQARQLARYPEESSEVVPLRRERPGKLPGQQTMMTRALAFGMLPHAHPDELKVLHFLAQQSDYRWRTGGWFMSMAEWGLLLGGMDRRRLHEALARLHEYRLIYREGITGIRGQHPVEHRLTRQFADAAVDYYVEVWVRDRLPYLVKDGADPQEWLANRHGIAKIEFPPRPKGF